jgi:pyruvate carboxylase subunit A
VYARYTVPPFYDPLIAKLIVWGRDRNEAIRRMQRALYEYVIVGIKTNMPFHKAVMENPRFVKGELETHFIERETTLLNDIQAIIEREEPLDKKLARLGQDRRKIAAIAAVTAVTQTYSQSRTKP